MVLSLHSPTNCQWNRLFQVFCRTKRKSLHSVLSCVLLRWLDKTQMTCKKSVCLLNIAKEVNGQTSPTNWMLLFWQRNRDDPHRVFRHERSWVRDLPNDIYSTVWNVSKYGVFSGPYLDTFHAVFYCCVIDNIFHISLYIAFNSIWMINKAEWKKKVK